ncbi:polysaccharide deacetylase family protein [Steroidobacter sp. S1-65]|uniref:Polysaccharide deacetylase family protein n=1 Tax=Steroidobacter gossypii TaxID=2805490 RepID=A0ABS1WZ24_9GAMM|nr:polysaccharide deacetylase family protein [Steroidobacter gossypii]MBM0106216.1 polysaccharide deacetylase family protein [Steroidobacter gossypii]
MKAIVRRLIASVLYYSGALWLLAARNLRGRVVVLMYHRVLPKNLDSHSARAIVVSVETFSRQMRFLRRFFNPLTLEQFDDVVNGRRPLPPKACLVTFDDGWFDNHAYALPLLREHGVPAVIFAATGYVGTEHCFWQERLTRALFLLRKQTKAAAFLREIGGEHLAQVDEASARDATRSLVTQIKSRPAAEIESLTARAFELLRECSLPTDHGDDRFLTWQEAEELAHSDMVRIGSHAHSHTPLPRLTQLDLQKELTESRNELMRRLRSPVASFAYPNGDYSPESVSAVRQAGYSLAFTTDSGYARPGADPLLIPRVNIHEGGTATSAEFLCRILRLL